MYPYTQHFLGILFVELITWLVLISGVNTKLFKMPFSMLTHVFIAGSEQPRPDSLGTG